MNPSHAIEATYVATVLARPALYEANRVAPEAISHPPYRAALTGIMRLRAEGQRVSPTSLALVLGRNVPPDLSAHLNEIPVNTTDIASIAAHLRAAARARDLYDGAVAMKTLAERGDVDGCREVLGRMMLAHDAGDAAQPVMTFKELIATTVDALNTETKNSDKRISTGMSFMDGTYKLTPGSLLVVGAYTNVGKSSLITTWMLSIAQRGIPCGIVSVEDSSEDYGAKIVGSITGINSARLWSGAMDGAEWSRIISRTGSISDHPLSFTYVTSRGLDEVLARIEYMARVRGCKVVVVDYLQAISHRRGKDIRERIDGTLEELIALCGRLGVALILASQVSRPEKGQVYKELHLNDLKESGSIEARAQCVVLLWREQGARFGDVKGKIAKAKRQPAGVYFDLIRDPDTGMLIEKPETY